MSHSLDYFWELFKSVSGGTGTGIIDAVDALAKSDRAKLENYFSKVIDQPSFNTSDYNRLRKFLIDLFATHRTISSQSLKLSDPRSLSNSDLDELFRSFGYPYSSTLKGIDEYTPLEQKIQFFLDLVNLYKVKGTPQSLVDVLQYYGITTLDIYEFFLKRDASGSLIFEGKQTAGTTSNAGLIYRPFNDIVVSDPHWLYTENQILNLLSTNKINLPSKSPYIGIQPQLQLDGAEISILSRIVQDQYQYYINTGNKPPANATITITGGQASLLELYLSIVQVFNSGFPTGVVGSRFTCYDGTNTDISAIVTELNSVLSAPSSRSEIVTKYNEYLNLFSRPKAENFLVDSNSAKNILQVINPSLYAELGVSGEPLGLLYSLLENLTDWVTTYIGSGFVDFAYALTGLDQLFKKLDPVVSFFKPIRARVLVLEALSIKSRLTNTILVSDNFVEEPVESTFHDFITGDSQNCDLITSHCERENFSSFSTLNHTGFWTTDTDYSINDAVSTISGGWYKCIVAHTSSSSDKPPTGASYLTYWELQSQITCDSTAVGGYYSRETYDCGSFYDVGAVTDAVEETIEDTIQDILNCTTDSTSTVASTILTADFFDVITYPLAYGTTEKTISLPTVRDDINYNIIASLRSQDSTDATIINYIITEKTTSYFTIKFSQAINSNNYYFEYYISSLTNKGTESLSFGDTQKTITLLQPDFGNYYIAYNFVNTTDPSPTVFGANFISSDSSSSFTVIFSQAIDTNNCTLEWVVITAGNEGSYSIPAGSTEVSITYSFSPPLEFYRYPLIANITDSTSSISSMITDKTTNGFTIKFDSPVPSGNKLNWIIPQVSYGYNSLQDYYQQVTGTNFDEGGIFDCTHGNDLFKITIDDSVLDFILTEDYFYILQEDGYRIAQEY